jgi:hypothetical protein
MMMLMMMMMMMMTMMEVMPMMMMTMMVVVVVELRRLHCTLVVRNKVLRMIWACTQPMTVHSEACIFKTCQNGHYLGSGT